MVGLFASGIRFQTRSGCSYGCLSQVSLICNCLLSLQCFIPYLWYVVETGHLSCILSHILDLSKGPVTSWVLLYGLLRICKPKSGAWPGKKFLKVAWPHHSMILHRGGGYKSTFIRCNHTGEILEVTWDRKFACFSIGQGKEQHLDCWIIRV